VTRVTVNVGGTPPGSIEAAGTVEVCTTWMFTEIIEESVLVTPEPTALRAQDYPVLAAIWDNEEDAAYDEL